MLAFSELAISKGVATKDEARSTTLKNIVTRWLNVRFLGGGGLEGPRREPMRTARHSDIIGPR